MAVLIDFDFVMEQDQPFKKRHLVRKSTMYNIPEYQHFSARQPAWKFDWWQLGLMVAYCLTVHNSKERPQYHTFQIPEEFCQEEFFKCAMKGEPSLPKECERIARHSEEIK